MNARSLDTMDPGLLVGLVNTRLRNDHTHLDDFCSTHDIGRDDLESVLRRAGYVYREDLNQFRFTPGFDPAS